MRPPRLHRRSTLLVLALMLVRCASVAPIGPLTAPRDAAAEHHTTLHPGERAAIDGLTFELLPTEPPRLRIDGTEYPLPAGREPRYKRGYGAALGWGLGLTLVGGAVAAFGEVKSSQQFAPESKGERRSNAGVIGGVLVGAGIIGGIVLVKAAHDARAAEVREEAPGEAREIATVERAGSRYVAFASVRATWTGKQRTATAVDLRVQRAE